ncbi:hypothetical protein LINGRAHAP2_LOCUS24241 [Linum grandiflorum]
MEEGGCLLRSQRQQPPTAASRKKKEGRDWMGGEEVDRRRSRRRRRSSAPGKLAKEAAAWCPRERGSRSNWGATRRKREGWCRRERKKTEGGRGAFELSRNGPNLGGRRSRFRVVWSLARSSPESYRRQRVHRRRRRTDR